MTSGNLNLLNLITNQGATLIHEKYVFRSLFNALSIKKLSAEIIFQIAQFY